MVTLPLVRGEVRLCRERLSHMKEVYDPVHSPVKYAS